MIKELKITLCRLALQFNKSIIIRLVFLNEFQSDFLYLWSCLKRRAQSEIRQRIDFRYIETLPFTQQDDGSAFVSREKICGRCRSAKIKLRMSKNEFERCTPSM